MALCCAAPGMAQAERPLVLAFDDLLPWKTYGNGEYGGAYTEIVRELARRTGRQLKISRCPLKRCLYMLEVGNADIIIGLRNTPERARYLHFLQTPYRDHSSDKVFYVQEGRSASIRSYADLAPLRIGTKLGAEYLERFAAAHLDDFERAMRDMAKDGTLDALYKRYYYDAYHVAPAAVQIK